MLLCLTCALVLASVLSLPLSCHWFISHRSALVLSLSPLLVYLYPQVLLSRGEVLFCVCINLFSTYTIVSLLMELSSLILTPASYYDHDTWIALNKNFHI